jgi:hypothetical protein
MSSLLSSSLCTLISEVSSCARNSWYSLVLMLAAPARAIADVRKGLWLLTEGVLLLALLAGDEARLPTLPLLL